MPREESKEHIILPINVKYMNTCIAAMGAASAIHPVDLVKTRIQIGCDPARRGTFHCIKKVVVNEGLLGLYKGISASLLRQATYATIRIGSFITMSDLYRTKTKKELTFNARFTMAVMAGAFGGMVGTPADVVLIRMEADGHAPKEKRRNYKNVGNGIIRIYREEGFRRLYIGMVPTMIRAAISNAVVLLTYPDFKNSLKRYLLLENGFLLQFGASMLASFVVSVISMPHDLAKTRIQNMRFPNGVAEYNGTIDVWRKVIVERGPLGIYRGFSTYYLRMGPYTVLVLIFLEQLNAFYIRHVMGIQGEARFF